MDRSGRRGASAKLSHVAGRWDAKRAAAVAAGGVAGAALRWSVAGDVAPGGFPWAILAVNLVGSLLLGVLLAGEWSRPGSRIAVHDAGAIGFCGGLTTFSTFSVEVAELVRGGDELTAALYVFSSVGGAIAAVILGAALLRRVHAVRLPLEEEP
jgi:fluoride exporter